MREDTRGWIEADKAHCWHPFTPQDQWVESNPLILVRGEGVWLRDSEGRKYIDGNSSIWTNIHGHGHPALNAAIERQLREVAHTSYLGFANPRASELAARLCALFPPDTLERVFFSDDGSTAIECAMKMAIQYRQQRGEPDRNGFIAFEQAYHGDTMGAASLGGVSRFHERFRKHGAPVTFVSGMEALRHLPGEAVRQACAVVIEPMIQGVNEMRPWPQGMLRELREWCDAHEVHLILDEVMTGFGRTGKMFACQHEQVIPDFLCVAKGLTGGYMPMAATLTTSDVYDAFRGPAENAFYYGHSYTANPLGCAVALASLELFEQEKTLDRLQPKIALLAELLAGLNSPKVKAVRQCGFVAGVELAEGLGTQTCLAMRNHGVLTRPIRDTIVIMLPLCATEEEIRLTVAALRKSL
ncbi:adenosylmethionine--8-amino-7-oxononanoate transaminase [Luteolibacter sp. GHJ8]|uniref:Adenosylmethionine-8-amino-7-oxononanoate aminotransferase n=1 Tax=Luteolibacter rhizosphaerae TaxID=2989719 RepID=A0ABT3G4I5_9BACT|nr:adenosylmethionine--8-amino-7-oxononanoate transaminase [Luteolibacter rhizosphaerae]MCW1914738.1 adenosylmethionine--8-amino-7-oxononanoate transaminase [Luteolibacter rhizosphaerae]